MKTEREIFKIEARKIGVDISEVETPMGIQFTYGNTRDMFKLWCASASREGYKLVPCNPTGEMWCGTARQLVKYMQMKDRYCPASLKKHFDRFIGEIPDWLNEEVRDWTSEHAFATADLGVFIYKAMYHEFKN